MTIARTAKSEIQMRQLQILALLFELHWLEFFTHLIFSPVFLHTVQALRQKKSSGWKLTVSSLQEMKR